MQIQVIPFGTMRVPAQAMFNGLPAARLGAYYTLDGEGKVKIAMNALLVVAGERVVLIDPGASDFLPAKLVAEYGFELRVPLDHVLDGTGYGLADVSDVIFTHLHFDHGSGAFRRRPGAIEKRFPNARYHVLKAHYDYAASPDPVEGDSFFHKLLKYAGPLCWLEDWKESWMSFKVVNGHTRSMVVPVIHTPGSDTYYLSDLVPMRPFLEPDVSSGYDLDPGLAMEEKQRFFQGIEKGSACILFHEHNECRVFYP